MSKALKCDSCGVCFDPASCKGEFISIREMIFQDGESYKKNEADNRIESFNLCMDCSAEFANRILFRTGAKKTEKSPENNSDTFDYLARTVDELVRKCF